MDFADLYRWYPGMYVMRKYANFSPHSPSVILHRRQPLRRIHHTLPHRCQSSYRHNHLRRGLHLHRRRGLQARVHHPLHSG